MKRNFFEWVAFVFLVIWQLPQNIIGAIMWLYFKCFGGVKLIDQTKWSFAFEGKKMQGGISLGTFCFLSPNCAKYKEDIAHELKGHTWDSRLMGPLYMCIIGIPSILNAWLNFTKCYYDFWPEKLANKHAGLEVDDRCWLHFKKEESAK